MIYLLDGSNILGQLGLDRHATDAKRRLVRAASSLARQKRAKTICFFDGGPDGNFATALGALTVRFAAGRSADDLIAAEAARIANDRVMVVTSDAELAQRVRRRKVEALSAREFARMLEEQQVSTAKPEEEDWENYFSDAKNRNV